jgi:glycosyltransferase involved in cell wall biosynthesis
MRGHVVIVSTSYPERAGDPSGHFVETEASRLTTSGLCVTVLVPGLSRRTASDFVVEPLGGGTAFGWPGVRARLEENPLRLLPALRFCFRARRRLIELAPTEVIAHWLVPSLFLTRGVGCKVTAVAHGSDVAWLVRLPRGVLSALLRTLLSDDVRLRFVSHRLRRELVAAVTPEVGERLLASSEVSLPPIDVSGTPSRRRARLELGIGNAFVALSVGRLVRGKRVDWALHHAPVPEGSRWVVIGDGPQLDALRHTHPRAEFLGALPRSRTLTWISAADVLVCCSEREGAPTVVREARELGTPVWTNEVGDVGAWAAKDPGISILPCLAPNDR